MKEFEEKTKILELIKKAKQLIPEEYQANLPPLQLTQNIPEWHNYEYNIWSIGEKIRQIININKKLRNDKDIYRSLLEMYSYIFLILFTKCVQKVFQILCQII